MYAKTGLRGEALRKKVRELRDAFIQQGLQAGYSRQQLEPYIASFDDMKETIEQVPRNVDIEFDSNVSPATQAVKEYLAKINEANKTVTTTFTNRFVADPAEVARAEILLSTLRQERAAMLRAGVSTYEIDQQIARAFRDLQLARGYSQGGFVNGSGTSTSDSIPAMLSKGEYVIKASAVGAYGVDFMNAINQQKVSRFSSNQSSSQSSSDSSVIYLSPEDRQLLRAAIDRPVNLYTENSKIASSANAGNVMLAQRGAR
jgi:hypothetical protein